MWESAVSDISRKISYMSTFPTFPFCFVQYCALFYFLFFQLFFNFISGYISANPQAIGCSLQMKINLVVFKCKQLSGLNQNVGKASNYIISDVIARPAVITPPPPLCVYIAPIYYMKEWTYLQESIMFNKISSLI